MQDLGVLQPVSGAQANGSYLYKGPRRSLLAVVAEMSDDAFAAVDADYCGCAGAEGADGAASAAAAVGEG